MIDLNEGKYSLNAEERYLIERSALAGYDRSASYFRLNIYM